MLIGIEDCYGYSEKVEVRAAGDRDAVLCADAVVPLVQDPQRSFISSFYAQDKTDSICKGKHR